VVVGRGCPRGPGWLEIVEAGGCVRGGLVPTPHHTTFILNLQEKNIFIDDRDIKRILKGVIYKVQVEYTNSLGLVS
jgi:hypothetical protein